MTRALLPFIDDEDLIHEVRKVLDIAQIAASAAEDTIFNNIIDPFSAVFDSQRQGIAPSEWLQQEKARQIQKTLQNAVGEFHQSILGHVDGWTNLNVGHIVDLRSDSNKILAEVKNKYNTTKGNHKKTIYDDLLSLIRQEDFHDYKGYYVEIIPKSRNPYNKPFTPSDNETGTRRPENQNIRVIDGRSFYELVTGQSNALDTLYEVLPRIIADITGNDGSEMTEDPLYKELYKKAYPYS